MSKKELSVNQEHAANAKSRQTAAFGPFDWLYIS